MSHRDPDASPKEIPWAQRLLERPFVLLGLGMAVMFAFYTLWGWYEVTSLPQAGLP